MANLNLEKVMQTSFVNMGNPSIEDATKEFLDFNRSIRVLSDTGRLALEDIAELIQPMTDQSAAIEEHADRLLRQTGSDGNRLFMPGFTIVTALNNGAISGVVNKPNHIPQLNDYGPGLMFAMLKLGQEKFAVSTTKWESGGSMDKGYRAVSSALTGNDDFDSIPRRQRHHIGGASIREFPHRNRRIQNRPYGSLRNYEHRILHHAGVSGVVGAPAFAEIIKKDPGTAKIYAEAYANPEEILDSFDGNLAAGSLDSTLGHLVLYNMFWDTRFGEAGQISLSEAAILEMTARHADGVNVH